MQAHVEATCVSVEKQDLKLQKKKKCNVHFGKTNKKARATYFKVRKKNTCGTRSGRA